MIPSTSLFSTVAPSLASLITRATPPLSSAKLFGATLHFAQLAADVIRLHRAQVVLVGSGAEPVARPPGVGVVGRIGHVAGHLLAAVEGHRPRQREALRIAAGGFPLDQRAAGIAEAEELRGLVEGLADGVVEGFACFEDSKLQELWRAFFEQGVRVWPDLVLEPLGGTISIVETRREAELLTRNAELRGRLFGVRREARRAERRAEREAGQDTSPHRDDPEPDAEPVDPGEEVDRGRVLGSPLFDYGLIELRRKATDDGNRFFVLRVRTV